jgi:phage terminase small subunit
MGGRPPAKALTPRQDRFVREYCVDCDAKHSAIRAGYAKTAAGSTGHKLLKIPHVWQAIQARSREMMRRVEVSEMRVKEELSAIAFARPLDIFDAAGNLRPPADWPEALQACVSQVEVVRRNLTTGDGKVDTVIRVRFWDKTKALEMLGRHLAMFADRVDIEISQADLAAKIQQGRERWYRWQTNGGKPKTLEAAVIKDEEAS